MSNNNDERLTAIAEERAEALRAVAREALLDPDVRVDVLPDPDGHRVVLRIRTAVSMRVPSDIPIRYATQIMRYGYVQLANELRERLRLQLNALGPTPTRVSER